MSKLFPCKKQKMKKTEKKMKNELKLVNWMFVCMYVCVTDYMYSKNVIFVYTDLVKIVSVYSKK